MSLLLSQSHCLVALIIAQDAAVVPGGVLLDGESRSNLVVQGDHRSNDVPRTGAVPWRMLPLCMHLTATARTFCGCDVSAVSRGCVSVVMAADIQYYCLFQLLLPSMSTSMTELFLREVFQALGGCCVCYIIDRIRPSHTTAMSVDTQSRNVYLHAVSAQQTSSSMHVFWSILSIAFAGYCQRV